MIKSTSSLPKLLGKINTPILSNLDKDIILYKDFEMSKIIIIKNELKDVLLEILDKVPSEVKEKSFLTVDYQEINRLSKDTPSCKDLGWHTDGNGNDYFIICWGNQRTEFLTNPVAFEDDYDVRKRNFFINKSLLKESGSQIQDGVLYQYDSKSIHRGQLLNAGQQRKFLRLCFSNYIKPRNMVIK